MSKNFLFFDVECADCRRGAKLYSFGFILTDDNFNIIVKDDHLINPNIKDNEWDWYVLKKIPNKDIKKQLYGKPSFGEEYPFIKRLIENPNHIAFGFSVANDLRYINQDAESYGHSPLNAICYDIQDFYNQYSGNKGQKGLSKIIEELDIDCSAMQEHISCDDAHFTMLVMKTICDKMKISAYEIMELCKNSQVNSLKYWENYKNKLIVDNLGNEIAYENFGVKALRKWFHSQYEKLVESYPLSADSQYICFSDAFLNNKQFLELIEAVFKAGYNITFKVSEANFYVRTEKPSKRDVIYEQSIADGKEIKLITLSDLLQMIGFDNPYKENIG